MTYSAAMDIPCKCTKYSKIMCNNRSAYELFKDRLKKLNTCLQSCFCVYITKVRSESFILPLHEYISVLSLHKT